MGQLARDPSSLEENTENCKRRSVGVFRSICDISNKSTGKSTLQFKTPLGFEYSIIFHCSFFQKTQWNNFCARVHLPSGPLGVFSVAPSCGVPPRLPVIGPQTLRRLGYLNVSYRFIAPFHPTKNTGPGMVGDAGHGMTTTLGKGFTDP